MNDKNRIPGPSMKWQAEPGMIARWHYVWESIQVNRTADCVLVEFVRDEKTVATARLSHEAAAHLAAILDGRAPAMNAPAKATSP